MANNKKKKVENPVDMTSTSETRVDTGLCMFFFVVVCLASKVLYKFELMVVSLFLYLCFSGFGLKSYCKILGNYCGNLGS